MYDKTSINVYKLSVISSKYDIDIKKLNNVILRYIKTSNEELLNIDLANVAPKYTFFIKNEIKEIVYDMKEMYDCFKIIESHCIHKHRYIIKGILDDSTSKDT